MGVDHILEELMGQLGKQWKHFSLPKIVIRIIRLFAKSNSSKILFFVVIRNKTTSLFGIVEPFDSHTVFPSISTFDFAVRILFQLMEHIV